MVEWRSTAPPWRLKEGELAGYDGFKHRKGSKAYTCVDEDEAPQRSPRLGSERDGRRLLELVGALDKPPREAYADAAYDRPVRDGLSSIGEEAKHTCELRRKRERASRGYTGRSCTGV
ncbi:MAG: hypothetical protein QW057_07475 [Candidatus Bathyarchaeia archaeon]